MIEKLTGYDTVCLGVLNSKHKGGMKKSWNFLHIKHYVHLKKKITTMFHCKTFGGLFSTVWSVW